MNFEDIKQLIIAHIGTDAVVGEETDGLQPALVLAPEKLPAACLLLRDHPDTYFDFLSCISAVDKGGEDKPFWVVYHLASMPYKRQLTLKVNAPEGRSPESLPAVPSVSAVWRTADWHEREAFDLMGVFFEGHPDLRRILLPEDWEGYPLRKDYQEAAYYQGISIK